MTYRDMMVNSTWEDVEVAAKAGVDAFVIKILEKTEYPTDGEHINQVRYELDYISPGPQSYGFVDYVLLGQRELQRDLRKNPDDTDSYMSLEADEGMLVSIEIAFNVAMKSKRDKMYS